MEGAWARRPATAVSRLKGRALLVLSARDLLEAAAQSDEVLVALVAPAAAAMAGFARAARDADAPLLLVRPSGASEETGPEEARDDTAFVEAAFKAADEVRFAGPMALLKEPPRAGSSVSDSVRVQREIDTGFTGVALAAADSQQEVRDAALAATAVCQRELGLEVVPLGGAMAAAELARQLSSRGAPPSAVRMTGMEDQAPDLGIAVSTETESLAPRLLEMGVRLLVASGPFLRALRRAAPGPLWEKLQSWADEKGATIDQAAARHQRVLRDLPREVQERLEALACFEALDLFGKARVAQSGAKLVAAVAALHPGE
ncbi:MAG: hypothetical protein E6J78_08715 [Deltaproteobacteria bacterium]|nr:MAG: hypothetical protein E6J78_08715 [Deltaproteobacteria bacterium]